jgi:hypothetical protein
MFSLISCESKKNNVEELKFNIRKYILNESIRYLGDDYNWSTLKIDSVKPYSKFLYFESEIKNLRSVRASLRSDLKRKNDYVTILALDRVQNEIDSLKLLYSQVSKEEVYYKYYLTVNYMSSLKENSESIRVIGDENNNILDEFFELPMMELEDE